MSTDNLTLSYLEELRKRKEKSLDDQIAQELADIKAAEAPPPSAPSDSKGILGTAWSGIKQVGSGLVEGTAKGVGNMLNGADYIWTGNVFADMMGQPHRDKSLFGKAGEGMLSNAKIIHDSTDEGLARDITSGLTEVGTGILAVELGGAGLFGAASKIPAVITYVKKAEALIKAMPKLAGLAKGTIAGVIATDPDEQRLSNILQNWQGSPEVVRNIASYLAADPTDTKLEGYLKNTVEQGVVGGALEGVFGLARLVKAKRVAAVVKPQTVQELEADHKVALKALKERVGADHYDNTPVQTPGGTGLVLGEDGYLPPPAPVYDHTPYVEVQTGGGVPYTDTPPVQTGGGVWHTSEFDPPGNVAPVYDHTPYVEVQTGGGAWHTSEFDPPSLKPTRSTAFPMGTGTPRPINTAFNPNEIQDLKILKQQLSMQAEERVAEKQAAEKSVAHQASLAPIGKTDKQFWSKYLSSQGGFTTRSLMNAISGTGLGAAAGTQADINLDGKHDWKDIAMGAVIGLGATTGGMYLFGKMKSAIHSGDTAVADEAFLKLRDKAVADYETLAAKQSAKVAAITDPVLKASEEKVSTALQMIIRELKSVDNASAAISAIKHPMGLLKMEKPLAVIAPETETAIQSSILSGDYKAAGESLSKDFNLDNISSTEDITSIFNTISEKAAPAIEQLKRGVQTNAETVEGAARRGGNFLPGMSYEQISDEFGVSIHNLNQLTKGTAFMNEKIVAARIFIATINAKVSPLAERIAASADPSIDDIIEMRRLVHLSVAVQAQVKAAQTEIARALQSFNIMAKAKQLPDAAVELVDQMGGKANNRLLAADLKKYIDIGDHVRANRLARTLNGNPTLNFLIEMRRLVLLSSPRSHVANIIGNALVLGQHIIETGMKGLLKGDTGEAKAMIGYLLNLHNVDDAMQMAEQAFHNGTSVIDPFMKVHGGPSSTLNYDYFKKSIAGQIADRVFHGALAPVIDATRHANLPFQLLTAEDEFFKTLNFHMALRAAAYEDATAAALRANHSDPAKIAEVIAQRVADSVDAPQTELYQKAMQMARSYTFTNNLEKDFLGMSYLAKGVQKSQFLQLVVPFVKTPVNIAHFTMKRVPGLNFLVDSERKAWAAGGDARLESMSRLMFGSMVMGLAAFGAAKGNITGGGGRDNSGKRMAGWQDYSVVTDNHQVGYGRIDPLASLMGAGADMYDILHMSLNSNNPEEAQKAWSAGGIAFSRMLTSKTYLTGLADALDALRNGDTMGPAFFQKFAVSMLAPSIAKTVEEEIDPAVRDHLTLLEDVKSRYPGLSKGLPPSYNALGEVVQGHPYGLHASAILPVKVTDRKTDSLHQVFADNEIDTSLTIRQMRMIAGVPLTVQQHSEYVKLWGDNNKRLLEPLVNSGRFKNASDDPLSPSGKKALVLQVMGKSMYLARMRFFQAHPDVRAAVIAKQKTGHLDESLLTDNEDI